MIGPFKKEALIESAAFVLLFTFGERFIRTIRGIIIARFLGPEEFGIYTLAFFFFPFVAIIAQLGIPYCFPRYISQYESKGTLKHFLKRTYSLTVLSSLLVAALCLIFSQQLSSLLYNTPQHQKIILLCAAIVPFFVLVENLKYTFNGLRIFKLSSLVNFSSAALAAVTGLTAVVLFPYAIHIIFSYLLAVIIVLIFSGYLLRKYFLIETTQDNVIQESHFYRKILRYTLWLVVSPVVFTMFSYTDRWMVNRFLGMSHVGIYAAGATVAGIISIFGAMAGNVLMPRLSEYWEQQKRTQALSMLDFILKILTIFLIFLSVILLIFRKPIIALMFGREYLASYSVIKILLVFQIMHIVFWFIGIYASLIERTYIPLIFRSAGLVLNIGLNLIFIPSYGMQGAAAASTLSVTAMLPFFYWWLKKAGLKIKLNTIFVCIFPVIFALDDRLVIGCFVVLLLLIWRTHLFISHEERAILRTQWNAARERFFPQKESRQNVSRAPYIAYIAQTFPALTQTFIYREIQALERSGMSIDTFAIWKPTKQKLSQESCEFVDRSSYVFPISWPGFLGAHIYFLISHPFKYLSTALFVLTRKGESRKNRLRTVFHFFQAVYMANKMRKKGIEHIHAHFSINAATCAMVISRLLDITFSFTAHNILFTDRVLLKQKMREALFIVAISDFTRRYLLAQIPDEDLGDKIHVVHCGLETGKYYSLHPKLSHAVPVIVFAAQLKERKGTPILIDALKILREQGHEFQCLIFGDGPQMFLVKKLIQGYGLQNITRLHGAVFQEELREHIKSADIFVLPCIKASDGDMDGIPVVLMEAMAMEIPTVSTWISGIPELIENKRSGLMVKDNDPLALAAALQQLIKDKKLCQRLGEGGRQKVLAEFDVDKCAQKLKQLFLRYIKTND